VDFNPSTTPQTYGDWFTEKSVRVVKYWCKHAAKKTIYQLSDGRVLDEDDYKAIEPYLNQPDSGVMAQPPLTLKNEREVSYDKITCEYASGKERLEGPFDWAGKFIPLVPVWGESVNVQGDEQFSGLVRPIKDAQRLFNWDVCVGQEVMANQPRAPFVLTAKMVEGYETAWQNLGKDNAPALFYNADPLQPGGPRRESPPMYPGGFFDSAQFASDLIKSVSNVVDAPIQSRASSGKAIQAVEHQQDVGNFDFIDNLARAKAFVGEILIDLIPKIYDTERQVMILGEDGKESYVTLNQTTDTGEVINDLSRGKYAVVVTVGQSYATRRMETMAAMQAVAGNPNPMIAALGSYGLVKNMDEPGMDEVVGGIRRMLIGMNALEPGEGDKPPPQQGPDPIAMAEAALKAAQAQLAQANAAKSQSETAQNKVETAILASTGHMDALQKAAQTDQAITQAAAASPEVPGFWGPPQQDPGQPPAQ
jgi:hypothetical protein